MTLFRLFHELFRKLDLVLLEEAVAHLVAQRRAEGVRHAAADDERIALADEALDDADLVGDLRTAQDGDEGTHRVFHRAAEELQLLLDEEAADRDGSEAVLHDARGGGVSAMRGAECVVDVDVAEVRELSAKLLAVLLLTGVEAGVFEQHALPVLEGCDLGVRVLAHEVGGERHLAGEDLRQPVRDGLQRELLGVVFEGFCDILRLCRFSLAFGESLHRLFLLLGEAETGGEDVVGLAEVGAKDHLRAVIHQIFDGGQRAVDTVLIRDHTVDHGDVEVHTGEALFAFDVDVSDRHLAHGGSPL